MLSFNPCIDDDDDDDEFGVMCDCPSKFIIRESDMSLL